MSTENTTLEDAAFMAGYNGEQRPALAPAEDAPAPNSAAEPATDASAEVDEYAGLPPKVREQLSRLETLERAASNIPGLEQRLRKAEGRLGDLNSRVPAPTPPAPQRMEKVEKLREDWPEVIDAMDELLSARQTKTEPAEQPSDSGLSTPTLDDEMPGWEAKLVGPQFQSWLATQDAGYRAKVASTDKEAVVLAALSKFDAHQEVAAQRSASAQRASQTRQARTNAAVTPETAGRREPATMTTEEDAFLRGFNSPR